MCWVYDYVHKLNRLDKVLHEGFVAFTRDIIVFSYSIIGQKAVCKEWMKDNGTNLVIGGIQSSMPSLHFILLAVTWTDL